MGCSLRTESPRHLIDVYTKEIVSLDRRTAERLTGTTAIGPIQALNGVGPVLGAVFVAEIGDVHRFGNARQLCSWAGMTLRHRESDTKVRRGSITKQGSRLLRWAAIEAVAKNHGGDVIKGFYRQVAERRGRSIGRVVAARKVLTLVFYGLRDGEIRCLATGEDNG